MSRYCVIGKHGLIGSALAERLGPVTSFPVDETRVLFHFGSYSHQVFEQNPEYCMRQTLQSFSELLPYCYKHGILFLYPSSALVYEKDTQFAQFKKTIEQLVNCYNARSIGFRIFPVYGPPENRSVIAKWCRGMKRGDLPVIYGDGSQARDFIHVDEVADQILSVVECPHKWIGHTVDIGTGTRTNFNRIVEIINHCLLTSIVPQYVDAPADYSAGIVCPSPLRLQPRIPIEEGVRMMLSIKSPDEVRQWA